MGAVANAAMLIGSEEWRNLITAASVYKAREVLTGENGTDAVTLRRRQLARQTVVSPHTTVQFMSPLVATVPAVANAATTVSAVPESQILSSVAEMWGPLADELIRL